MPKNQNNKESPPAAIQASRRLAHFSTTENAGKLIFCVRYGYRSFLAAMAAEKTFSKRDR